MVREVKSLILVNTIVFLIALSIVASITIDPRWVIVMVAAAIAFGVLAPVIAARRLFFLAGTTPHSALLAVVMAIPLARISGVGDEYFWSIIVGILLVYSVGYAIYKGVDSDTATAVFVAFTASASVIALYYVLTAYPIQVDVWAFIVGDPLLATWKDAFVVILIATSALALILSTYREQVIIGVDKDCAMLAGIRVKVYDWLLFTILAITTITMLKIIGFVLEHVFILLPAAIAATSSESSVEAVLTSLCASLLAALIGLYIALLLGVAPAGATGLLLFTMYLVVLVVKKIRGG